MQNLYFQAFKKSLSDAVTQAAAVTKAAVATASDVSNQVAIAAKDIAEDSVAAALGQCKVLREYKLSGFTAVGGAHNTWRLFAAKSKKPGALYQDVSVWVLDKKGLIDTYKVGKQKVFDPFFEQERKACSQLMRLKHPGVVRLIEPMEETRTQIVLVTEPVVGSLQCILNNFRDVPTATEALKTLKLSPLEIKHGLINLVECLSFLHTEAKLVHCSICLGNIYVTADGSWKLSGFSHIAAVDPEKPAPAVGYDYSVGADFWELITKPLLSNVAPELVTNTGWPDQNLSGAADVFSLATVVHEMLVGSPLIPAGLSPNDYKTLVQQLAGLPFTSVPQQLSGSLRSMLSCTPATRPPTSAFASADWFSSDMLLRALRFLDTILQRDMLQKAAFLKDLEKFWNQMDARVLKHKVLPVLLQEMRHESTLLAALPVCIAICQTLGKDDFMAVALPAFKPLFLAAQGETLMALLRSMHVLCKLMTSDAMEECVLPPLLNALTNGAAKLQDEVVRVLHRIADDMSYSMTAAVLPHLTEVSMRTTSLLVRTSCLGFMARVVPRLGIDQANAMLDLCQQITSVDKSAGTVVATYALTDALSLRHGAEMTAMRVLPLLCPLLLTAGLTQEQFADCTRMLRDMIGRVEANRGAGAAAVKEAGNGAAGQTHAEMSWDTPLPINTRKTASHNSQPSSPAQFTASTAPAPASALPPSSSANSSSLWETSDLFAVKNTTEPPAIPNPASTTATWDSNTLFSSNSSTSNFPVSPPSSSGLGTPGGTPTTAIGATRTTPLTSPQASMPMAATSVSQRPGAPHPPRNIPMNQARKLSQSRRSSASEDDLFGGLSLTTTSNPLQTAPTGNTSGGWPAATSSDMKASNSLPDLSGGSVPSHSSSLDLGGDLFGGLSVAPAPVVPALGPPPAPASTIGGGQGTAGKGGAHQVGAPQGAGRPMGTGQAGGAQLTGKQIGGQMGGARMGVAGSRTSSMSALSGMPNSGPMNSGTAGSSSPGQPWTQSPLAGGAGRPAGPAGCSGLSASVAGSGWMSSSGSQHQLSSGLTNQHTAGLPNQWMANLPNQPTSGTPAMWGAASNMAGTGLATGSLPGTAGASMPGFAGSTPQLPSVSGRMSGPSIRSPSFSPGSPDPFASLAAVPSQVSMSSTRAGTALGSAPSQFGASSMQSSGSGNMDMFSGLSLGLGPGQGGVGGSGNGGVKGSGMGGNHAMNAGVAGWGGQISWGAGPVTAAGPGMSMPGQPIKPQGGPAAPPSSDGSLI